MSCEEKTGFLFPHRCTRPAVAACAQCGRQLCQAHQVDDGGRWVCRRCAGGASGWMDRSHYGYRYYPGFGSYGRGWGSTYLLNDVDDFTDGDAAAVTREGDDDFESDLGAS